MNRHETIKVITVSALEVFDDNFDRVVGMSSDGSEPNLPVTISQESRMAVVINNDDIPQVIEALKLIHIDR